MRWLIATLMSVSLYSACCGAAFQNLDFEASVLLAAPPNGISIAPWSINGGGSESSLNLACLGSPQCVFVHDGGAGSLVSPPLQGTYSVLLQSGTETDDITSISQTGDIPATANSLLWLADDISANPSFGGLSVLLGGTSLTLIELSTVGSTTQFGAAIPAALAGTTSALEIRVMRDAGEEQNIFVDTFEFSQRVVPEPSTWSLLSLAWISRWVLRRRR